MLHIVKNYIQKQDQKRRQNAIVNYNLYFLQAIQGIFSTFAYSNRLFNFS